MKRFLTLITLIIFSNGVFAASINAAAYRTMQMQTYQRQQYQARMRQRQIPYWQAQSNYQTRNKMYTSYPNSQYNNKYGGYR